LLSTDKFKAPERPVTKPFRLSVNDIFKGTGSGFCVSGRVETGMVQVADKVLVQPQNEGAVIKGMYCIVGSGSESCLIAVLNLVLCCVC
jgi:translation elongation factor EF-1alpha